MRNTVTLAALLLLLVQGSALSVRIDRKPHWDSQAALQNPHKGWYHHYPDNHINKYVIMDDSHLLDFRGMDHLYIRLAWAYLEPREGRFDWAIIDSLIDKWVSNGLGIAFRISCKETSTDRIEQQFATPKWVMEAGAKGNYYRQGAIVGPDGPWEPIFDDPVFLEKLENLLRAFAARYDGKSWLRYVDIGSIGDWGEGNWTAEPGSAIVKYAPGKTGPDFFRGALNLLHATYIGYHGDAHDWLTDNPELTVDLLNRCGYWYFLHSVDLPDFLRSTQAATLNMVWENRGVAPAYHPYVLKVRLAGPRTVDLDLPSGNRKWMPAARDGMHRETYTVALPPGAPPGSYELKLKLHANDQNRDVLLALDPALLDQENYYSIATLHVTEE